MPPKSEEKAEGNILNSTVTNTFSSEINPTFRTAKDVSHVNMNSPKPFIIPPIRLTVLLSFVKALKTLNKTSDEKPQKTNSIGIFFFKKDDITI
ncbi:hypothetical protein ACTG15_17950 [Aeromonas sp. 164P]|uniref:hypothetical protein n=1 Tax=Aeromonas enteropelogenes TaxID=29489 RepID=UPI0039891111